MNNENVPINVLEETEEVLKHMQEEPQLIDISSGEDCYVEVEL